MGKSLLSYWCQLGWLLGLFIAPLVQATPMNVLFIVADDLRDTLGCYGQSQVQTPNIDRLAARGVRFDRAYVQYPVCNPSRSSFLTGLRPDQTGIYDNKTALRTYHPDVLTWPELLKTEGWYTAAYGKIFHLGGNPRNESRAKFVDLGRSWHETQSFEASTTGKQMLAGRNLTGGALNWCHWGMAAGTDQDQPDGQIADAVIQKIETLQDRPWVLGAGFMKPHDPFIAPASYFDRYPFESLTLYRDPATMTPAPPQAVGFGSLGKAFAQFTDTEKKEFLRAYYACTTFMDAQVGRLLVELDRRQLWDNTVVVFIGDHGYHLGERNWWNKNTLFERSCRTPLIIAAPGIQPGVATGLVEFIDLFPTIVELCGLTPPEHLAGVSLVPLLQDPSRPGKSEAHTVVFRGGNMRGDSIRTDRWRYTEWSDGAIELYDHHNDPGETQNVAASQPDWCARWHARLVEIRPTAATK